MIDMTFIFFKYRLARLQDGKIQCMMLVIQQVDDNGIT